MREAVACCEKDNLVLERSASSKTGFVNVIEVGKYFQARFQLKGDGRGGSRKRRQVALPGLFPTAVEAAQALALFKLEGAEKLWPDGAPLRVDKPHKKRRSSAAAWTVACHAPLQDVPMPPLVVHATPIPFPCLNAPLVAASPLPLP